jgi:UDP-4-amino-4,6-dideoxy-N-acetyl-beta-L-altrosamine transaminase
LAERFVPYGRQSISEEDIAAVVDILRSDWLTQGPSIVNFEKAVAEYCGAKFAVAVSNGTAALHLAALAAGFGAGDEVITSPITFVASANCIVYAGATPVFADIDDRTYCIDPTEIAKKLTPNVKAVIPVHFSGQPCNMKAISKTAKDNSLVVIEDGAHAIGASYEEDGELYKIGSCAHSDMTIFSFHPVKHITTGEGGMITTNSVELYQKLLLLRTHGVTKDPERLTRVDGPWYYEQQSLGFNYRITDFQCALGLSQLVKLDSFISRRREIVQAYNSAFGVCENLITPFEESRSNSSWHLYMLQVKSLDRLHFFNALRNKGLGVNVHYIPVHLQPFFSKNYGFCTGDFPKAEEYYSRAITIPLFPTMTDDDVQYVINAVLETVNEMSV